MFVEEAVLMKVTGLTQSHIHLPATPCQYYKVGMADLFLRRAAAKKYGCCIHCKNFPYLPSMLHTRRAPSKLPQSSTLLCWSIAKLVIPALAQSRTRLKHSLGLSSLSTSNVHMQRSYLCGSNSIRSSELVCKLKVLLLLCGAKAVCIGTSIG